MTGGKPDLSGPGAGVASRDLCRGLAGIPPGPGLLCVRIPNTFPESHSVRNLPLIYPGCKMTSSEFGVRIANFD